MLSLDRREDAHVPGLRLRRRRVPLDPRPANERPGDDMRPRASTGRRIATRPRRSASCGRATGRAGCTSCASARPTDASATRRSSCKPRTLGSHRVAVVLATQTWQAYNFADANGDGWGDSWYVSGATHVRRPDAAVPRLRASAPLQRLGSHVPHLVAADGKQVDFLSDQDIDALASGDELAHDYDLVVFPGHEEYVTAARARRDHALPQPRRQPRVPRGEQHVLGRADRPAADDEGGAMARHGRPEAALTGGAVRRLESRRGAAAVHGDRRDRGAVALRRHRTRRRLDLRRGTGSRSTPPGRRRRRGRSCSRGSRTCSGRASRRR